MASPQTIFRDNDAGGNLITSHVTNPEQESRDEIKLFVCTDSNGKLLKPRLFWTLKGTEYKRCYTVTDVKQVLDTHRNTNIGCILISCGANDIEQKSGMEVANDIIATVNRIKVEHPATKIVVSEVTPHYERDNEVQISNGELRKILNEKENVIIVTHDNLRDAHWTRFRDKKHVKDTCGNIYAGNLKSGLRRAHNMPHYNRYNASNDENSSFVGRPNQDRLHQKVPIRSNNLALNEQNNIPIDRRLRRIADNNSSADPKQNLISKLNDVIKAIKSI